MTPAPDYERLAMPNPSPFPEHQDHAHPSYALGASVRAVIQGLILAGIVSIVALLWRQNDATAAQNVSIAQLQVQIAGLSTSLVGLPALSTRVTTLEAEEIETTRRVSVLENNRVAAELRRTGAMR